MKTMTCTRRIPHGERAEGTGHELGLDLGFLACRDIPRLFYQRGSGVRRVVDLGEPDRAERRRIVAEVRRILEEM